MQFVGDAMLAVFGAPVAVDAHAERAVEAARAMHAAQHQVNEGWAGVDLAPFRLGIGLSTGAVAAALLGSAERLEYTIVGDTMNLSQRLQQWARAGETVLSEATFAALTVRPVAERFAPARVKGRPALVAGYRMAADRGFQPTAVGGEPSEVERTSEPRSRR